MCGSGKASVLILIFRSANSQMPVQDDGSTAEADAHVTFHCKQPKEVAFHSQQTMISAADNKQR